MVLREIADMLSLHESTISRVTTQKYMLTPRGTYELKYFFGSHVATDTGGAASATAIRALIKQLIGAEDPQDAADRQPHRRRAGRAGHPGRPAHGREVPGGAADTSRQSAQVALGRCSPWSGARVVASVRKECCMNLNLTGHHLEITPAIRDYVVAKLDRVTRHFDHVIDVNVVLSVDKLRQKVEANLHIRGKDIHAECIDPDMYAAIDALADKLDRQVLKAQGEARRRPPRRAAVKRDRPSARRRKASRCACNRRGAAYNRPSASQRALAGGRRRPGSAGRVSDPTP